MPNVVLAIFVLLLGSVMFGAPQSRSTKPKVDDLIRALHSDQWTDRAAAVEQLRHDSVARRDQRVRTALWDLADRENHLTGNIPQDRRDQEAYVEYSGNLFETLESIVDWKNPNEVCILAHTFYNDDSPFAADLANAGQVIMPCLMQMNSSQNIGERSNSLAVMIQIRAKGKVDLTTTNEIKSITIRALHDPDENVRESTVDALRAFGGEDMIPALQEVAETDPAPAVQGVSIRTTARKAIEAIRKRTNQMNSK